MLADHVVRFQQVDVCFGKTPVLESIDLALRPGERVALIGASGAGKSTLIALAGGYLQPTRGCVTCAPGIRSGLVLQDPVASLNPGWPIERIIGEPLSTLRPRPGAALRRQRVRAVLERVHLSHLATGRRAAELSIGQCQRVALARALIAEPDLLLADEPISALDASVAAGIIRLLDRVLTESGAALLVASHDLLAMAALVERVIVLDEGRIVEDAPPRQLLAAPQTAASRRLLTAARFLALP